MFKGRLVDISISLVNDEQELSNEAIDKSRIQHEALGIVVYTCGPWLLRLAFDESKADDGWFLGDRLKYI